ncbi:gamma-glutamyltransferase [Flavilitoribacter nigricans DSM 23189 = NBRC 102662]|uniref:Glutathione hydrolase proenzyme n=2 Tax=Flavilitoribacter TaxID=2762562 RepID=A0A2D0NCA0_FLAN2|nr:gamma-glutamyltransferase [Flavilitoribacter nigricans DSM 23189 = NBRC 102662]
MVVSPHPLSTQVGIDVLRQGGNAVDATIALQFAMAVVYPRAGNIGGGGFMVIRQSDGQTASLDYREKAPAAANRNMYLDSLENVIDGLSTSGHLAAGVPGTVAGMFAAHQQYGKLPIAQLIEPAIELAREGFRVSQEEADRLNRFQEDFHKYNEAPNPFLKENWMEGDLLMQAELGQTLERIRDQGAAGFYGGETARLIADEMAEGNGIITPQDLQNYQAKWRTPLTDTYKQYRVISMPPSSSGGVALLQMLKMLEPYPLSDYGFHSREAVHLMAEVARRAYADRAEHMGDMDFYPVPIDSLLADQYLLDRMLNFQTDSATTSDHILAGNFTVGIESFETTHTSVVDGAGNAVSVTTTLNSNYGCKVWVDGAGFFLNNEMDDFSVKPGVPNQFGLIGAEANAVAANKRMLSSMTPTIIEKDGKLFMVLGTPGGSTIITAVMQVFLNVAEFGMDLEAAVGAKRFHHQWLPDVIMVEEGGFSPELKTALEGMGHSFREVQSIAKVKAIQVLEDGRLHGVADPRNTDDDAKGY